MQSKQIGYIISGSFEDSGVTDDVGFDIPFPKVYATYEEAKKNVSTICARMEKLGESVVIRLYENECLVETIRWDEWWKYKCNHIKEECKNKGFVDACKDYEPCATKFEDIFKDYCGGRERTVFHMQYLAYGIEPVIVTEDK